jgi:hypothetical protein
MGKNEDLAIELLRSAFGDRWVRDDTRILSFGPDGGTREEEAVNPRRHVGPYNGTERRSGEGDLERLGCVAYGLR